MIDRTLHAIIDALPEEQRADAICALVFPECDGIHPHGPVT